MPTPPPSVPSLSASAPSEAARRADGRTAFRIVAPLALAAALLNGPVVALSQAEGRHPDAPDEIEQFAFLVGDWHCLTRQMQPDGSLTEERAAEWHGRWVLGGWAIADEWISTLPDGREFRGVNLRSFDSERGEWDNRWLAPIARQWKYFSARREGETMVMLGGEGSDPRGEFIDRNTFHDITGESFLWRKDRSWDGGETWLEGLARIECSATGG